MLSLPLTVVVACWLGAGLAETQLFFPVAEEAVAPSSHQYFLALPDDAYQAQFDDLHTAPSTHYYTIQQDFDDARGKRDLFGEHPEAYLRPPVEGSSPAWQDGNNWDLGFDASEILSPPMPLSLGVPYDTIKYSSPEAEVPDVSAAASHPPRYHAPKKYARKPSPVDYYEERLRARPSHEQDRPRYHEDRYQKRRPYDYEERPRQGKRHTPRDHYEPEERSRYPRRPRPDQFDDYSRPSGKQHSSFVKTDQYGHYKWGVRHN